MVLFARSLGASATVLGIMTAIVPLMTIFQIPAAHYLPVVGYKRMILMGWSARTFLIFLIAFIPFIGFLGTVVQIIVLLSLLFIFNLLRGIASGAWWPWITELVPEKDRAHFLSRDALFTQMGSLFALLAAAIVLYGETKPWQFSLAFLVSATGGTVSLLFLKKIPDIAPSETTKLSGQSVPWKAMLCYRPFLKLLIFNVLVTLTVGGLGVFTVAYLKTNIGLEEASILFLIALSFVASLGVHRFLHRAIQRSGGSAITVIGLILLLLVLLLWWASAAKLIVTNLILIGIIQLFTGTAMMVFNVANTKNMMSIMPVMGRNHFFALFSVFASLSIAFSPILWGILIDHLAMFSVTYAGVSWNNYSIYFAGATLLGIVTLCLSGLLPPNTVSKDADAQPSLLQARFRRIARYLQR